MHEVRRFSIDEVTPEFIRRLNEVDRGALLEFIAHELYLGGAAWDWVVALVPDELIEAMALTTVRIFEVYEQVSGRYIEGEISYSEALKATLDTADPFFIARWSHRLDLMKQQRQERERLATVYGGARAVIESSR